MARASDFANSYVKETERKGEKDKDAVDMCLSSLSNIWETG